MDEDSEFQDRLETFAISFVERFIAKLELFSKVLEGENIEGQTFSNPNANELVAKCVSAIEFLQIPGIDIAIPQYFVERFFEGIGRNIFRFKTTEEFAVESENVLNLFKKDKEIFLEGLVEVALDIFQSFESQFMLVTSKKGSKIQVMNLLAKDAVERILNWNRKNCSRNFILENCPKFVVLGPSWKDFRVRNIITLQNPVQSGPDMILLGSRILQSSELFEKSGIFHEGKFYSMKNGPKVTVSYGYRRLMPCEKWNEMKMEYEEMEQIDNVKMEQSMFTKLENRISFKEKILKKIKNNENLDKQAVREIIKEENEILLQKIQTSIHLSGESFKKILYNFRLPVEKFTGRIKEIEIIHKHLNSSETYAISQTVTIAGLGGIGKSELARQYAYVYYKENFYQNLIWITAESKEQIEESFKNLMRKEFPLIQVDNNKFDQNLSDLYRKLSTKHKTLIILDNAEEFLDVKNILMKSNLEDNLRFLITSRNKSWDAGYDGDIEVIEIDVFTSDEAKTFVSRVLDTLAKGEEKYIEKLTQEVQYFPLALAQAVTYIKNQQEKFKKRGKEFKIKKYLNEYEMNLRKLFQNGFYKDFDRYTQTVFTTWKTTLTKFEGKLGKIAIDTLKELSYFSPDKIKIEKVYELISDEKWNAIELLDQFSIIQLKNGTISIHRLVQTVVRQQIRAENEEVQILESILNLFNKNLIDKVDHALCVWKYALKQNELVQKNTHQLENIVTILIKIVRYEEAHSFAEKITQKLEEIMDKSDSVVLKSKMTLGRALFKATHYHKAFLILQDTLNKQRKVLGDLHPDTLQTFYQYGCALDQLGDSATALSIFQDILIPVEIYQHCGMMSCKVKDRIGEILMDFNKIETATKMLRHSLVEKRRKYDENHREVIFTETLLARALAKKDRSEETLKSYEDQLENIKKLFGEFDPETLRLQHEIGEQMLEVGQIADAVQLIEDVFNRRLSVLGESHADTIKTQKLNAKALSYFGEHEKAEKLYQNAIEQREKALGHDLAAFEESNKRRNDSNSLHIENPHKKLVNLINCVYGNVDQIIHETIQNTAIPNLKHRGCHFLNYLWSKKHFQEESGITKLHESSLNQVNLNLDEKDEKCVNVEDNYGNTPLIWASIAGNTNAVKELLKAKADINLTGFDGSSALHWAIRGNYEEIIEILIENGAPFVQKPFVNSIIHEAVGNEKILKLILKKREVTCDELNSNSKGGFTPFMWAVILGNIESMKILKNSGVDLNATTSKGWIENKTPLFLAIRYGNLEIVKWLLENGADINQMSPSGFTVLHEAAACGNVEILTTILNKMTLENGIVDVKCHNGSVPLILACIEGNAKIVEILLDQGADINCETHYGESPLYLAIRHGHLNTVKLLIERGANIHCKTIHGATILHGAAASSFEIFKIILNVAKSEIHAKDIDGDPPFEWACQQGNIEAAKVLLSMGADVNLRNKEGETPLYWASKSGHAEMVKWLLENGAKVDAVTKMGQTILHVAAVCENMKVFKMILNAMKSVDINLINAKNIHGESALDLTQRRRYMDTAKVLMNQNKDNLGEKEASSAKNGQ